MRISTVNLPPGVLMFNFLNKKESHNFCCTIPSTELNISENGKVSFCCTSWQPHYLGNANSQTLLELMENSNALKIQRSVDFGDFSFCKKNLCPSLVAQNVKNILTQPLAQTQLPPWTQSKKLTLYLNYDKSCNLRCPSCRNGFIFYRKEQLPDGLRRTHEAVVANIFELLSLGYHLRLNITGSGDPFASAVYSELMEEICKHPNVTLSLQTNGILMTQERFHRSLKEKTESINVSVDAGTETTYEKLRPGGKWAQLIKNIQHLDRSVLQKELPRLTSWQLNFIVQNENYEEIPNFLAWVFELPSKPHIWFNLIDDWGHLGRSQFNQKAIWKTSHPKHQDFLQTLTQIPKEHPQIMKSNLMRFYAREESY